MKANRDLLRRTFLVLRKPPFYASIKAQEIEQGYFLRHPKRDLLLQRVNRDYFVVPKESHERVQSKEVRLSKAQFDFLWPFTEGQRVFLNRSIFLIKKLKIILDVFLGEHAPLMLATVNFPTLAASKAFEHLEFLGEEVTGRGEYETISLAMYGAPESKGISQVGALPYVIKDGKLQVLLITSSSGNRWILPKGQQEPGMTAHEVALMEAVEEGGVLGSIRADVHTRCQMSNGSFLQLYALKISKLLGVWPEEHLRLRRLLPLNEALELMEDRKVGRAVKRLAALLKNDI
ncbi:MAG: NUDIX domain-containing protein [Verrucomicrobiae bacterium]|jgi:8-oxo-dGTP pyrophosphatase MutT (NUDIX family)|nr:NUDIX domain-containing protein [Verrucomicrobiae bacterium]